MHEYGIVLLKNQDNASIGLRIVKFAERLL